MPEGIVVELVIVAALMVLVAGALLVGRRRPPPSEPPRAERAPDVAVQEPPAVAERPAEVALRPSLRDRLTKSRRFLTERLGTALGGGTDDATWEEVEAILIQADAGVEIAARIAGELRARARSEGVSDQQGIKRLLADELVEVLDRDRDRSLRFADDGPSVWLVVGVNGTGKTTTIGKLARDLGERRHRVALAAADTFRAAADEQLAVWAERAGAELVKHQPGADPGAVAFDAFEHARARGLDVLIVDTAGRLHTKTPLMDELGKVRRVIEKQSRIAEVLLVIDATGGQNGLVQAREFAEKAGVTGVVLTKLDGTAKGGIVLAIESDLGIPIKLIGVGEGIDDLEPFEPAAFVDALLE